MKIDFNQCVVTDISGASLHGDPFWKDVARYIYMAAENLDLVSIAMQIHKDGTCEMSTRECDDIVAMMKVRGNLSAFVRKAVIDFLDEQKRREPKV